MVVLSPIGTASNQSGSIKGHPKKMEEDFIESKGARF